MPFIGEVQLNLYWGTLYDDINIPLHPQQIINDASRSLTLNGYIVWQTTWLSMIRINLQDYQDIVGVQYCNIIDAGTENKGSHWYDILDYQQISQGCVELGLRYNTLLTIPLSTWQSCSGILKRWSVDNDPPYGFINSPEPIDLTEPLALSWQIIETQPASALNAKTAVVGYPYDMTTEPEVITYTNPNGEQTNVYYPKLNPPEDKITSFISGINTDSNYSDGMQYSIWNTGVIAYRTYNKAIALGIDIVVNGYILLSNWVNMNIVGNGYIQTIEGKRLDYTGQFPLYNTQVNNAKAGAINTTFTLASYSGDSVTVNNFQVNDTSIIVFCDPASTGGLRARFRTYMHELIGIAGWVKSPPWQPLTVTSGIGFGVGKNEIANIMSADTLTLDIKQRNETQNLVLSQMLDRYRFNVGSNLLTTTMSTISAGMQGNIGGAITNTTNGIINAIDADLTYNQQYARLNQLAQQANERAQHQANMLQYNGNVGRMAPPMVKYAMASDINSRTYDFTVMCAKPSANDVKRLDTFFTAYGYNVDGLLLTSPNQLHTREKFTFIQADEVRVNRTIYTENNERIGDKQTIADIQRRFSAGLRIWSTTPDFDYTKPNPIKEN